MNRQAHGFQLRIMAALTLLLLAAGANAQATHIDLQGTEAPSVIDGVDIFSGKLEQVLPLLKVHGRGEVNGGLYLPLRNPQWRVMQTASSANGDKQYEFYSPNQGNPVTNFARAGYTTLGKLEVETKFGSFYLFETPTVTEIRFTSSSGSIIHFRDTLTNGEPFESRNRGCVVGFYHPNPEPACSRGRVFRAIDGSNAIFVADADVYDQIFTDLMGGPSPDQHQPNISGTIYLSDGTRVRIESALNTIAKITDRNGNNMTFEYVTEPVYTLGYLKKITDSLNREITLSYGDATQSAYFDEIIYKGFGTTERRIRINYTKIENAMLPGQSLGVLLFPGVHARCHYLSSGEPCDWTVSGGGAGGFATSIMVPSSVVFPNGQDYQFYYNNYLELARIKSPLGSYTDYSYSGTIGASDDGYTEPGCGSCGGGEIYRRVSAVRNLNETGQLTSEKTFSNIPQLVAQTHPSFPILDNVTVDIKDANQTVQGRSKHYFYDYAAEQNWIPFVPGSFGKEYKTEILDTSSQSVLRRSEITWQNRAPFPWCGGGIWSVYICTPNSSDIGNGAPAVDPRIIEIKTTLLDTNQVSKRTFLYDQNNNVTETRDYDFGSGAPGTLLRISQTDYLGVNPVNGVDYLNPAVHISNLVANQRIYDGNGTLQARTDFEYDNYNDDGNNKPIRPRNPITGLDPAYASVLTRGNLTKTTRMLDLVANQGPHSFLRYDIAGNVVSVKDPLNHLSQFEYDDSYSDNVNHNTFAYPTSITSPIPDPQGSHASTSSLVATSRYDFSSGRTVSSTDANGQTTTTEYNDVLDRLTRVVRPSGGGETSFEYGDTPGDLHLRKLTKLDANRSIETRSYFDGLGRTTRSFLYEGSAAGTWIVKDTKYDALGRASATSNAYKVSEPGPIVSACGLCTTETYDALGRVRFLNRPDGSVVQLNYVGNTTTITDQEGKARKIVKDVFGQVAQTIEDPNGASLQTTYTYDAIGNVRKVTEGIQQRFYMYDALSRLIRAKNPEENTNPSLPAATDPVTGNSSWANAYTYDEFNNLATAINPRNVVTTLAYDALNRNTNISYTNDPAATPNINRYYDGWRDGAFVNVPNVKGRQWQTETSGATGSRLITDNISPLGAPLAVHRQFFDGAAWSQPYPIQQAYNLSGEVTSLIYPSGHTVNYTYDDAGRTSSFNGYLGDNALRTYSSAMAYSTFGSMVKEQFGTTTPIYNKHFYNSRGQLAEIRESTSYTGPDDTTWNRGAIINYYSNNCWGMCGGSNSNTPMTDNNGNLKKQEVFVPLNDQLQNAPSTSWWQRYDYDAMNRLQRVHEFTGNTQTEWQQEYVYDRYGNRTINTGSATSGAGINNLGFEVDTATNRLYAPGDLALPESSRRMQYDASGNQAVDSYTGQGQRIYNAENRMSQAWANGQWQTYTYDANGLRVRRKVNGVEIWQVHGPGGELLAEYGANAAATNPQKEYGYRNGQLLVIAGTGALTATAPAALTAAPSSGGGNVVLNWSAAAGATNYRVERKGAAGSFALAGSTAATNLTDTGVSSGSAYLYRVCAANAQNNCTSVFSNIALGAAVGFPTDPTITSSADDPTGVNVTKVKAAHITELRTAVNAVRSLAGLPAAQWTHQTLTPTVTIIAADDVRDLRLKLDEALAALSIPISNYDDQTLAGAPTGTVIRKVHITQLRQRATSGTGGAGGSSATAFGVQWLVTDQLGTPRMVFDETGSLASVKRHDYLPFGEPLLATQGARTTALGYDGSDGIRQKFTGYEHDSETELDFAEARYYSSLQGRFASPDSVGGSKLNPQTLNLYSYTNNNPLRSVDPSGHWTFDVTAGIPLGQDPKDLPPPPPPPTPIKVENLIQIEKSFHVTITLVPLGIVPDGLEDAERWITGRLLGASNFGLAFVQVDPEAEGPGSEAEREEEERWDEERDFELEPWKNPNAIPPVEIDPLYEDPDLIFERYLAETVPALEGETSTQQLGDAIQRVATMEGSAEEKFEVLKAFATQIKVRSGSSWNFEEGNGTDGSFMIIGSGGYKPIHVVVISPQGNLFVGGYRGFDLTNGMNVTPNYNQLRPFKPK